MSRSNVGWGLMMAGALLLVLISARYFTLDPESYFPRQREVYERETLGLIVHIAGMIPAAILGPFQFVRRLRESRPRVHRMTGRLYIAGAVIGAVGGLYMAQFAASGAGARVGFALLGAGVLITTGLALRAIRGGRVETHRDWMTRSYALIFAAVTLRLYLPLLEAAFGEYNGYLVVAWACWVPNLLVAEWIVRSRSARPGRRLATPA